MAPFFVGNKGGKYAAFSFSFPPPSKPSPKGKALSLRAEAPKGACGSGGVLLFGRGVLWGTFWVRFSLRPLAGALRMGDMRVLPFFFSALRNYIFSG